MLLLKLNFIPNWDDISKFRKFVNCLLSNKVTDETQAYRISMTIAELMENVCKFSAVGGAAIEIEHLEEKSQITVSVKNITRLENIEQFKYIFSLVNKGTAREAYRNMMLRSIKFKDVSIRQLGLARIRYEGNSNISYKTEKEISKLLNNSANKIKDSDKLKTLNVKLQFPISSIKGGNI